MQLEVVSHLQVHLNWAQSPLPRKSSHSQRHFFEALWMPFTINTKRGSICTCQRLLFCQTLLRMNHLLRLLEFGSGDICCRDLTSIRVNFRTQSCGDVLQRLVFKVLLQTRICVTEFFVLSLQFKLQFLEFVLSDDVIAGVVLGVENTWCTLQSKFQAFMLYRFRISWNFRTDKCK